MKIIYVYDGESVKRSEKSVQFYQITRRHSQKRDIFIQRRENLKSEYLRFAENNGYGIYLWPQMQYFNFSQVWNSVPNAL
jgi:hypothetical protein